MASALFLASVALLGSVNAAPAAPQGFSVQQVASPYSERLNYIQKTANVYRKYKAAMPAGLEAAAATVTGTVTATPGDDDDSEYVCQVTVGSQTLPLDFDTGSSDLWVFSSQLPASESAGHQVYTPGSSAKKLNGYTWAIVYQDQSGSKGDVYTDKVTIGGITVSSQAVEAATSVSSEFVQDTSNDGLVGLGFENINTVEPQQQQTWFGNAKSQLAKPLFTADLKYHAAGSYDFGYIDSSKYTGSITYADISTGNGVWEFTGSGYAVGSGSFVSSSIDAIADTGTTLVYVPAAVVKAYYAGVTGAKNNANYDLWLFPCANAAQLPSLTLGIGSFRGTIPASYMNFGPVTDGSSSCVGGIQSNAGIGLSIYGDLFIKSVFVVFDASVPRIGFANKNL